MAAPIIAVRAKGIYNDNSNKDGDVDENIEDFDSSYDSSQQIREMYRNNSDDVVALSNEKDKEELIEYVKKYFKEEELIKNKEFEFGDEFEILVDKNRENYFYILFLDISTE
ncbi:hypothetical protein ABCY62_07825 [Acetivibrio clariflavus]|uniref:hypothetical protein n=1 Tax=Acetivibrio clariflavus TaxID=288965 RepID=UPI0031F490D1